MDISKAFSKSTFMGDTEFPLLLMPDIADIQNSIKARRKAAMLKIMDEVGLKDQIQRVRGLQEVEYEGITLYETTGYIGTAAGSEEVVLASLKKSGKSDDEAKAISATITPVSKIAIARQICQLDPPTLAAVTPAPTANPAIGLMKALGKDGQPASFGNPPVDKNGDVLPLDIPRIVQKSERDWCLDGAEIQRFIGCDPDTLTLGKFLYYSNIVIPKLKNMEAGIAETKEDFVSQAIKDETARVLAKLDWIERPI